MCLDRSNEYVHENVELSGITKQIMPGPSCDLEELQTLEVNVTLGFASGDSDLLGLPFLKVTLEPRHYLYIIALPSCVEGDVTFPADDGGGAGGQDK